MHGQRAGQVLLISARARLWAAVGENGRRSRKAGHEIVPGRRRGDAVADAPGIALVGLPPHDDLELQPQQLVERQPVPGPVALVERLRSVDGRGTPSSGP